MNDYENMSPADRETSIRRAYDTAQRNINTLVSRLAEEYRILEDLRDLIAEIDIYGAEDMFCQPSKPTIAVSSNAYGYDF